MGRNDYPPPVRVCFVIENLLPAGTELWIVRLIERLDRRRVRPSLCILDGRSPLSQSLEPRDCPVLRLELPHLKSLRSFAAAARLGRFLQQQSVDVVQVHHADPTYLAVPVSRWAGVPTLVQTKYDVGYWLRGWDLTMHRFMRRWIDITVANCEACREAAVQQERAPAKQVVVIHNGIALDAFSEVRSLTESDFQSTVHLGMVANLRPIKDPQNLLKALEILVQRGHAVHVHFAGDGELREALAAEASRRSLNKRVTLHGHIQDVAAFWQQMQIGVLCSRSEGMPHAVLEAMAAGRPMVATRVGGNQELIEEGESGLLVEPGNAVALADALERLVNDPAEACKMAHAARLRVSSHFGLDSMVERFQTFYEGLGRRRGHRAMGRKRRRDERSRERRDQKDRSKGVSV